MPISFKSERIQLGMLSAHRDLIRQNHNELVEKCNLQPLIVKLLEKNVYSEEMAKRFKITDEVKAKRLLFDSIVRRGPKAFDNLISALQETHQIELAYLLQKRAHAPSDDVVKEDVLDSQKEPLNIVVQKATRFYDDLGRVPVYQTNSKHRGTVLIINNKQFINNIEDIREGSEVDVINLKELFKQMYMNVYIHTNKSKEKIEAIVTTFAKMQELKVVDMLFVFIMSHGHRGEHDTSIVGYDGKKLDTSWVEDQFNNKMCPSMQKKPKIFVYQLCRGEKIDYGISTRIQTDSNVNIPIRTVDDMLIAHSTLKNYESHRDIIKGSWFIERICEVFMEHACNMHIEEMLKIVDNRLEPLCSEQNFSRQTSVYTNQGFKNCYIHPGIYKENNQIKYFE